VNARSRAHPPARVTPAGVPARASARGLRGNVQGFSLIVAMLMLAVIGLASAAIMRNATSGDQIANNNRLQTQANQYAQLALRYCENQMALGAASRLAPLLPAADPPAWTARQNWSAAGGSRAAHTLAASDLGGTVQPRVAPQCLMEATAVPNVYTVTARGYSADWNGDPTTGATRNGSSVWLQATIYAVGAGGAATDPAASAAANGPLSVRRRLWQQLLTPPF
jgi:type IV pilus assembly protein PilX